MASPTVAAMFAQRLVVGVGDMGVSNNPSITLSTYALGSCVGVAVFDPLMKVGGLLHIMLPESSISAEKAAKQPAMFADTGLPLLFRAMVGLKGDASRYRILLAGGASVLCTSDMFKIGERNARAISAYFAKTGFHAQHTICGGTINRTVHLEVGTGNVSIKTPTGTEAYSLG